MEEEFLIAAAGDISNTSLSGQKITANLLDDEPYDAILTLGDNQYNDGALSAYNSYFDKTWGKHRKKLRPTPGNHEYNTPGAKGYYSYFGSLAGDPKKGYYSFDVGPWHLIALNSNSSCGAVPCKAGSAQEKWLRQDLAAHAKATCTLAYWHHPRFSSGEHGNNSDVADLWKALHEHGVDVVLNGHDHDYERFAPQTPAGKADAKKGIVQIVIGTGGTGFRPFKGKKDNSVARQAKSFGLLKMVLRPAGYDFEFVGEPGSTFVDKGSGKCH
ncbi:MAG: alkaline phosphatase [Myxococcales bacterium]|nr:MAG: alkaline phosphatase [Myxococcales bacterium]